MKNTLWTLAALVAASLIPAHSAYAECNTGMVTGKYVYSVTGTIVQSPPGLAVPPGPVTILGILQVVDGRFRGTLIQNFNGNISPPVPVEGTFTVNPDCTGTARDAVGLQYFVTVAKFGAEVTLMPLAPGVVLTATAKRI